MNTQNQEPNPLQQVYGIGPVYARALNQIGVFTFADLTAWTPEQLAAELLAKTGIRVQPERIVDKDWIGQAHELAVQYEQDVLNAAPPPARQQAEWQQHAGFSLFFDHGGDDDTAGRWRTRLYHEESGEDIVLDGTAPDVWVSAVLARANLPHTEETAVADASSLTDQIELSILNIAATELEPAPDEEQAGLLVNITFALSGDDAPVAAAEGRLFRTEARLLDEADQLIATATAPERPLQPETFTYHSQQMLIIPQAGQYRLQCDVTVQ